MAPVVVPGDISARGLLVGGAREYTPARDHVENVWANTSTRTEFLDDA